MNLLLHGIGTENGSLPPLAGGKSENAPATLAMVFESAGILPANPAPPSSESQMISPQTWGGRGAKPGTEESLAGTAKPAAAALPVITRDALAGKHGEYDMVLTNPPFGKKSSVMIVNRAGEH